MANRFYRIAYSIILFLSVLFLPFWVSLILTVVGMFAFTLYFEGVVLLLISDLLYGVREGRFSGIVFISLIISAVFLLSAEFFKKKTRFSSL